MRRLFALLTCLFVFAAAALASEQRGPTTPEERKRALEVIQKLEADPMSPSLEQDRAWVHEWVIAAPDVNVLLCRSIVWPLQEERNSDPRNALLLQNLLAMAAFELNNPDRAKDLVQMQLAGAQGMIRAYANILRRMPSYKSQFMESLRAKQESGRLLAYVSEGSAECRAHGGGTQLKP
jgi:antitoxin component HigA of HigAB toxin-antitoxin module